MIKKVKVSTAHGRYFLSGLTFVLFLKYFAGEKDGLGRLGRWAPPQGIQRKNVSAPRNSKEKCIHPKEFADFIADPVHIYTLNV